MGRLVDFGGTLNEYNRSLTGEQADLIALWMDWASIGYDLRQQLPEDSRGVKQVR